MFLFLLLIQILYTAYPNKNARYVGLLTDWCEVSKVVLHTPHNLRFPSILFIFGKVYKFLEGGWVKGGFDVVMFCGVCEILSDEFDPGEWGSADRALVRGQVELQGFLCRGVFVQTKDMSQEWQTSIQVLVLKLESVFQPIYLFIDGYLRS